MTSFPGEVDLDLTNTEAFASAGGHYREGERLENTEWRNGLRPVFVLLRLNRRQLGQKAGQTPDSRQGGRIKPKKAGFGEFRRKLGTPRLSSPNSR